MLSRGAPSPPTMHHQQHHLRAQVAELELRQVAELALCHRESPVAKLELDGMRSPSLGARTCPNQLEKVGIKTYTINRT